MPNVPLPQGIGAGGSLRVNTLESDEGSMTLQDLTALCTTLSTKVESLEADLTEPPTSLTIRETLIQEVKIPQPNFPTQTPVANEVAFTGVDVVHGGAATTVSSTDARQGIGNIPKSPTLPHDSPLPRGHTPGSDEDKKTVTTSQARRRAKIIVFDDEEDVEDPSKQGGMIEETDQDARITLVQINAEDQVTPAQVSAQGETHTLEHQPEDLLGVFSATKVLAEATRKRREVVHVYSYTIRKRAISTGSGGISIAEESVSTVVASMPVSIAGMVQEVSIPLPVATKDKGKAIMQESEQPKKIKQREQVQISRDEEVAQKLQEEFDAAERQRMAQVHQAAQGFIDAEWDDVLARVAADEDFVQQLQAGEKCSEKDLPMKLVELVNQRKKFSAQQKVEAKRNKPMTHAQQKDYMSNYIKNQERGYSIKQLKSLSFEQVKDIFETTMRGVQSFVPMGFELEVQRLKRAGQEVLEKPVKRQKIREASGSGEEQSTEKEKELSEEELQKLLVIVLVKELVIQPLQVRYPIIDWEVYY
ncbi:hypothetical protein Tco_0649976 [Tanacetum coccineum]